ncbi:hypothetical protein [Tenacibaculum agarivorans]|uniref:hypothetical protein n=1 Tax=Tenacibaculum agarivorans TaxID=1908389 RepID=UPI00094B996F|nr:hypothetical protein [Tenacibaculum agarivorans]
MTSEEHELISDYLNDRLSSTQIVEVEQRMRIDSTFREQVLIEQQLFETLNPDEWSLAKNISSEKKELYQKVYKSKATEGFKKTLEQVNTEYQSTQRNSSKKSFKKWYTAAAAILIIGSLVFLLPRKSSSQELYAESIDLSELPSMVVRNTNSAVNLNLAQEAFEAKEFQKALELILKEEQITQKISGVTLLYKGIAYLELKNYDQALEIFKTISSSTYIVSQEGHWYKALLFLKKEDRESARKVLNLIITNPNHYKYKEAKKILKEL